ncbi:hypothetical protein [Sphingomonas sp. Ag1]|uniref:hypothetical protein n=1 Tax=Sphingomonas sp. Ag1 TaxID=1642949 RepID=UPI0006225275|nr:hypothetical protein [Sphingomonas sp. Ag1]KKI22556.1 hypothetical protein XM50_00535 [Sphingomonas sp. Ag1]
MPTPAPPAIPQDMRDLLIRLDQRVGDGFQNINARFDEANRRSDAHESRIGKLEEASITRQAYVGRFEAVEKPVNGHKNRFQQLEGATKGGGIVHKLWTAALGAGAMLLAVMGWQISVEPKAQAKVSTTVEQTTTLPTK